MTEEEKRNKKIGLIATFCAHGLLLLSFLFMIAWREPDPPIPEYGIEISYGLDAAGTGDVQPTTPVTESPSEEEAAPENIPEETTPEEAVAPTEVAEEVETVPVPVEEQASTVQESPHVVEREPEKIKEPEPKKEKEPKPAPAETQEQDEPEENTGAQGSTGESNQPQNASQGNDENADGDAGDEEGSLDSRALVGSTWDGAGSALSMTGWVWDFKPNPNDNTNENGRIVFEIKIDDMGEIISIRTLERSVSPAVEKVYRAAVEELTFSKTSNNTAAAPTSTGKITFFIKSK